MLDLTALAVFIHRQCMNISVHHWTFQRKVSCLWTVKLINACPTPINFVTIFWLPLQISRDLLLTIRAPDIFQCTPCCLQSYAGYVIQDIFQFLTQAIETPNLLVYMSRKITNYKLFGISFFIETNVSHFDI